MHRAPVHRPGGRILVYSFGMRPLLSLGLLLGVLGLVAPPAQAAPPAPRVLTPVGFGAVGDGTADDTAAVQRALDALRPGDVLRIAAGRVYRHTDVLAVRVPGVRITGPGVLLATDEERSEVLLDADDVTVDGLVLRMQGTTRRWDAFEQMKLRLAGHQGITVRGVQVQGAAAAGVYVGSGASHFTLEDVRVSGTRADGIHVTGGASDGVVSGAVVSGTGDDGIGIVSYEADGRPVQRVDVLRPRVSGTTWGRGVSVVGGQDITITDAAVQRSDAAGIYIASEGAPYSTLAPRRVTVRRATLEGANTDPDVDHGALLVYAGRPSQAPTDIAVTGLRVRDVRSTASWQVGLVAEPGAAVHRVAFTDVRTEGPATSFVASGVPAVDYRRVRWVAVG